MNDVKITSDNIVSALWDHFAPKKKSLFSLIYIIIKVQGHLTTEEAADA